jgi:cytochrome c
MERPAGKVPDFTYSGAMESSGLVWDEKTLDDFLTMPLSYLSGTNMGYAGLFDEKDRADLIGYLKNLTNDAEACDGIDKLR